MNKWNHFITVGMAEWIYRHDIQKVELKGSYIRAYNTQEKYIDIDFVVLYNNEILFNPSNHSLLRLSNEVANSLFIWTKSIS